MALTDCGVTNTGGTPLVDNQMNNLFGNGTVGDGATYTYFEVRNLGNGSLTGGKLWLTIDPSGGTFAVAVANGTAQSVASAWASLPDATGLTYTSPASSAAGLTVPTLAAGTKVLFAARRDLTSASVARPEKNRFNLGGTVPIGF